MGPRLGRGGAVSAVNSEGAARRIAAGRIHSARGRKKKGALARPWPGGETRPRHGRDPLLCRHGGGKGLHIWRNLRRDSGAKKLLSVDVFFGTPPWAGRRGKRRQFGGRSPENCRRADSFRPRKKKERGPRPAVAGWGDTTTPWTRSATLPPRWRQRAPYLEESTPGQWNEDGFNKTEGSEKRR